MKDIKGKVIKEPTLIKQDDYEVGDRVLIKKKWESGHQNRDGEMDHWLGKIMTVRSHSSLERLRMDEDHEENDGFGWSWDIGDIEGKVVEEPNSNPIKQKIYGAA